MNAPSGPDPSTSQEAATADGRSSPARSSAAASARARPPSTRSAASTSTSRPGELTAIVGPSGSGKSTLMHLLAGPRQADRRPGLDRRRRGHLPRRQGPDQAPPREARVHLPVLQPRPGARRGREHRAAAADRRQRRRSGLARPAARDGRARRPRDPPALRALRRPAAAGRDRPGADLHARRRLRRRADRQPRLEVGQRRPRPAAQVGRRVRPDGRRSSPTIRRSPPTPIASSCSPTARSPPTGRWRARTTSSA